MSAARTAILTCCLALTAPAALADGFYVGAGIGSTDAELSSNTRISFDSTGYQGFVGYGFTRYLAVELSYTDFGDLEETSGTSRYQADATAIGAYGVGVLPVTPRLSIYARLGWAAYDSKVTLTDGTGATTTDDDDGSDLTWGFGFSYHFTRRFGLRLEWESFRFASSDDVTFTSLDAVFRF